MGRVWGRWLVVAAVTIAAGGCGSAAGDGDLVDDWATMAEAKAKVPATGCHDVYGTAVRTQAIPCEQPHTLETVYVGEFPASVTAAPASPDSVFWGVVDECERRAATFLGGQWYDARVHLAVEVPTVLQWEGGGRWYRCDVTEVLDGNEAASRRTGSLRDAVKPGAPLARQCVTIQGMREKTWDYLRPIDCAQPHDAEYAGSFKVPGVQYPKDPNDSGLYDRCWDVIARYVGGTRDGIQLGRLASLGTQKAWNRGDRYVACYAWHSEGKLTRSVKGLGNGRPG